MPGLFDWIETIYTGKAIVLDEDAPYKDYPPFAINNGLSQNMDTILIANEMNKRPWLSKEMQFKFFCGAVSKKKRMSKWAKVEAEPNQDDIDVVSTFYDVNLDRAKEYLKLLKPEHIEHLRKMNNKGGAEEKKGKKKK